MWRSLYSILSTSLLALAFVGACYGAWIIRVGGATPWSQVINSGGTGSQAVGDVSTRQWIGYSFSADNTGTLDSVTINCQEEGTDDSGTDTIDVFLYDDSAGEPGSQVANGAINNVSLNDLPNTYGDHQFNFSTGPSITSSTTYHIVLHTDQTGAEYVTVRRLGAGSLASFRSSDGVTWTSVDSSTDLRGQLDGTTP